MSNFRVIGGGPNPFPVLKQRTLSSDEILRVLSWDPNHDMDHGRLRAKLHQLETGRYGFGVTREQQLLEWAMGVEPKRFENRAYDNPARLAEKPSPRQLSLADFEYARGFNGADPKTVSAADVRLLAQLEAAAESESERRVVARVLGPIRAFHDKKEEEAELHYEIARNQPSGWRCATVRDLWEPVLAERLAEEVRTELEPQLRAASPELRDKMLATAESDARAEARQRIRDLWTELDGEASEKVTRAKARLSELARGADPVSSVIARRDGGGIEEGRRRGREAREAREARADAFGNFQRVG